MLASKSRIEVPSDDHRVFLVPNVSNVPNWCFFFNHCPTDQLHMYVARWVSCVRIAINHINTDQRVKSIMAMVLGCKTSKHLKGSRGERRYPTFLCNTIIFQIWGTNAKLSKVKKRYFPLYISLVYGTFTKAKQTLSAKFSRANFDFWLIHALFAHQSLMASTRKKPYPAWKCKTRQEIFF